MRGDHSPIDGPWERRSSLLKVLTEWKFKPRVCKERDPPSGLLVLHKPNLGG